MEGMAVLPMMYASVYVGDLHQDVTESQLYDAFIEFGTISSVRVCRDSISDRSLGYGYVNFAADQDAIRAIEAKNNSTLNGKVIRVMWSNRDPVDRKSGVGNVFVKNLSCNMNNAKLHELFQKYGFILSAKVSMSDDGKSRGHGFVQFQSEDSAISAINELNGTNLEGKQIYVGKFVKKTERMVSNPDAKYTNLYMKNLDPEVSEEKLKEVFSKFGSILSFSISKDDNGVSKGFGFVNYHNHDDAKRALEALNGSQLGSKELYVARAQKKAERLEYLRRQLVERKEFILKYQVSNIYVKNLNDSVTDEHLEELFRECGTITSSKVMRDNKGISKGFGFVCFSSPSDAMTAINNFHGYMFHGKPLYVATAQRKADRKVHLQNLYAQQMTHLASSPPVIHGGYAPFYYQAQGVVPHVPTQPGLLYQPLVMNPAWRPPAFAAHSYRQAPPPSPAPRRGRSTREAMGGSGKPSNNGKDAAYWRRESYILSSMLAESSLDKQKEILGERLYPLVSQHQPDVGAKITGMLLQMDNSELLLLLESPELLTSKVEEAFEVLKRVSNPEVVERTNYLSAEVAVN